MSRDLVDRLRDLPPELPDVPNRLQRVRQLAKRKRQAQLLAVASTMMIAVAVPVALAVNLSHDQASRPQTARPATLPETIARSCSTAGFEIAALPATRHPVHTSSQAVGAVSASTQDAAGKPTVFPAVVRSPISMKFGLGPAGAARTTWVIYQLETVVPPQRPAGSLGGPVHRTLVGTRIARVRFVDDATLKSAGGISCAPVSATQGNLGFGIADGTRVTATGLISPGGAGYVLCFEGGTLQASFTGEGPTCRDQVALISDRKALEHWWGQPRNITGTWRREALQVEAIGPPRSEFEPSLITPPCPTPAGGWAAVPPSKTPNLDSAAFEHYRSTHHGVVTAISQFRPARLTPVLTIASMNPAATRSALQSAYPRSLCVVRSQYSAHQVRSARIDVERAFDAHRLPGVYGFGSGVSTQGQVTEELEALTDRPELHKALPRVPTDMLVIHAWIRQLS